MHLTQTPWRQTLLVLTLLVVLVAAGTARAEESAPSTPSRGVPVRIVRDLSYYEGPGASASLHRLDLYLPRAQKDFPVLVFVHGGGWSRGDKNELGIYNALGRCFARQGIGVVCPNYRLSPTVKHPEHVRDIARAVAWTVRNIARYGGSPSEVFISGHSAGGHLAALLAVDESYLKAEGLTLQAIRGALPMSGLYTIPEPRGSKRAEGAPPYKSTLPTEMGYALFSAVFGDDPRVRSLASPIAHVAANLPPFLILCGDNDLPFCDRPWAEAFFKALRAKDGQATFFELSRRNHVSILWNAIYDTDQATQRMVSFILTQVVLDRLGTPGGGAIHFLREALARYGTSGSR